MKTDTGAVAKTASKALASFSGSKDSLDALPSVDAQVQLKVLGELTLHLDTQRLVEAFAERLQDLLQIDGLAYRYPVNELHHEVGTQAKHSISYGLVPSGSEHLGELQIFRKRAFANDEQAAVEKLLALLMMPLRNALRYRDAIQSALTDALTGTGNRLALNTAGKHEIEMAARHGMPLSLLLVDIDNFKPVNDTFGHAYGDEVLRLLANVLRQAVRKADGVYRYGGEEFVVLLANTDHAGAASMAERIRAQVATSPQILSRHPDGVTVSIGAATLVSDESLDALCERADGAMYEAKRTGRNRVVCDANLAVAAD